MNLTTESIIARLDQLGHLKNPFGAHKVIERPVTELTLNSQEVKDAIRSYQALNKNTLDDLVKKHHGRSKSFIDGDLGPATKELFTISRCGLPDYSDQEMAVGQGNWKRCNNIGEYHCAIVSIKTKIPSFLEPHFDEVWERVVNSYAELGLMLIRDDNHQSPQINVYFQVPDSGWIGLAIVSNNSTCSSGPIWAKFDQNYRPSNIVSEWTTLLKHEFGHNCGMMHSNGGVMNPSIVQGLPISWRNDPSYPLLSARFGGAAVPRQPPNASRKMVLAWQDNKGNFEFIADVKKYEGGDVWPK